jgi:hypothetical protein
MSLNLDEIIMANNEGGSVVNSAIADGVESEKCIVTQYRTTKEQLNIFNKHLESCELSRIPIEWVIDIADESNGWFYGTAYHYNDETNMIHIMVPDKNNPTFDGEIPVDYRTMHMVECVDGKTDALFNKIVRDSVIKVRWEVEWFEEGTGDAKQNNTEESQTGRWVKSVARYYIQYANQLLVEDEDFGQDSRGFVMFTADQNLRLTSCIKGKGIEDFTRLITENIVQSSPNALEDAVAESQLEKTEIQRHLSVNNLNLLEVGTGADTTKTAVIASTNAASAIATIKKLADVTHTLKECLSDVLDDRERLMTDNEKASKAFLAFALSGDLDAGLKLFAHAEETEAIKKQKQKQKGSKSEKVLEKVTRQEQMDAASEDAWYLCQKVEKYTAKLLKSELGSGALGENVPAGTGEVEYLRKLKVKLQKEIEERDRELEYLREQVR